METQVDLCEGGLTVGHCTLRKINRNLCYLCNMVITAEFRGQGYYPKLRAEAKRRARAMGYKGWIFTVRPDNEAHFQRMYIRYGPPINPGELQQGKNVAGLWWECLK